MNELIENSRWDRLQTSFLCVFQSSLPTNLLRRCHIIKLTHMVIFYYFRSHFYWWFKNYKKGIVHQGVDYFLLFSSLNKFITNIFFKLSKEWQMNSSAANIHIETICISMGLWATKQSWKQTYFVLVRMMQMNNLFKFTTERSAPSKAICMRMCIWAWDANACKQQIEKTHRVSEHRNYN